MPTSFFEKSSFPGLATRFPRLRGPLSRLENATRRAPLVLIATAAMSGIVLADHARWLALGLAVAFGLSVLGLLISTRHRMIPLMAGAILSCTVFSALHHQRLSAIQAFPFAAELAKGSSIEITGTGWIADRVESGIRSASTRIEIEAIQLRGVEIDCRHRVPVWIQRPDGELSYGRRVEFTGLLHPLDGPTAPGGFDPRAFFFRESGSLARLEIREGDRFDLIDGMNGSRLVSFAQSLRDELEQGLLSGVSPDQIPYVQLIAAMSLGARENTPEDLEDSFRRSGTMHLFAVSGLHVAVVAGLLFGTLLISRVPRRYAVLIVIPLLLFYAVLTGLRPSAIRAALMLSVVLASFAVKEKPNLLNSLALAALLILAFNTQQLFLPGFQLSFAVLLFIALFAAPLQDWLSLPWLTDPFIPRTLRGPIRRMKDRFVTGLAMALAVSLVSWLGSLGLLVWHFQSFAPVGIVANVFMVPLASLVVSLAVVSLACFGLHLPWLSGLINQLNVGLTILLTTLAQFFGSLPGAYQNSGGFDEELTLSPETLRIDIMSERGGSAMLVEFPGTSSVRQTRWIIDPGGTHTYRQQMLPLLRSRGINQLDAIILTHGDIKHIGETATLLSQFRPDVLFESTLPNRSPVYREIDELANRLPIQRVSLESGQRLRPHPNATIRILSPDPNQPGRLADDQALVLKLQYGDLRILMTSDAGFETEKLLLESGVDLTAEIWIRGQHIEAPSGLPAFVNAISPEVVISSSAAFPSTQVIPSSLRRFLEEKDIPLLELDETGVVTLRCRPQQIEIIPFSQPERRLSVP